MKKLFLYAVLIGLWPATTFADNQKDGNHKGPVSEYIKQHVTPVISAKRQAFDVLLSATEKNELASIREQLQQLRENHKAAMQARSEKMVDGNAAPHERSETWSGNHAKMKELIEQVHSIAENHTDQLDRISNELAPQKAQWKSDIAKIVASEKNEDEGNLASLSGNGYPHYGVGSRFNKMWSRTGFLLLDPAQSLTSDNDRQASSANDLPVATTMSIFPNPATNQFALNLSGLPSENKLIVTDMTGKIIVERENVMPEETIACNDLSSGVYFVRLSAGDQTINQKLIISH